MRRGMGDWTCDGRDGMLRMLCGRSCVSRCGCLALSRLHSMLQVYWVRAGKQAAKRLCLTHRETTTCVICMMQLIHYADRTRRLDQTWYYLR